LSRWGAKKGWRGEVWGKYDANTDQNESKVPFK